MFDLDVYRGRDDELKIEHSKLSEDELREYAILATEVRRKFRSSAEAAKINSRGGAP